MPYLSVFMPARNAENTINHAVRSTLRAMPKDSELLVYDDASVDSTAEKLDAIADPRLRVIGGGQHRGVVGARNHLLDATDAELVACMDADDISLPWRFRAQIRAAASVDMVFSTVMYLGVGKLPVQLKAPVAIGPDAFPLHLLLANPVAQDTMVGRAADLRRVGGYRDVPAEDYDLWIRLAANGVTMRRLALPTLVVRMHESSLTATADWRSDAARDQQIVDSYSALAGRYLEHPVDWYEPLRAARRGRPIEPGQRSQLVDFMAALTAAGRNLAPHERQFLQRKAQSILARARDRVEAAAVNEAS